MRVGASWSFVVSVTVFPAGLVTASGLAPAAAADAAQLKVLVGTPAEKGRWRMTFDKVAGGGDASLTGRSMSVCIDAGREMVKELGQSGDPGRCTFKVLEDSTSRGVIETTCDGKRVVPREHLAFRVSLAGETLRSRTTRTRTGAP